MCSIEHSSQQAILVPIVNIALKMQKETFCVKIREGLKICQCLCQKENSSLSTKYPVPSQIEKHTLFQTKNDENMHPFSGQQRKNMITFQLWGRTDKPIEPIQSSPVLEGVVKDSQLGNWILERENQVFVLQGTVSRKPRKFIFGPEKPFLVNLLVETEKNVFLYEGNLCSYKEYVKICM